MISHYFKIAWRNIYKNKIFSAINILGLSAGIAFTLLIAAYVWNELQVNRQLRNADRQYILQSKWKQPNMGYELATLGPLAKSLKEQYPNLVANYYRWDGITSNVSKGGKIFREGLQVGDSTMLNMFGFPLLYGDPATALKEPFSAVITEEKAKKYFGKEDVIGQTLTIESFSGSKHDFMITGIMKQPSTNSITHLVNDYKNEIYIPLNTLNFFGRNLEIWNNWFVVGYIELQPGVSPKDLDGPIQQLVKQNTQPFVIENLQTYLVPLPKYYIRANNGLIEKMLYTLSFIALFILIMAIINFVNISISKAASRMREIGVRKVLGGMRRQLIVQFFTESVLLVLFATALALLVYYFARPVLSNIIGKEILSLSAFPVYYIFIPLLAALIIGILAGIYPAIVLSGFKSVDSLKGKLASVKEKVWLRKSLVAFQFCIAAVVLTGAIIISKQVNLFFSKNLGYNKDYIISAQVSRDWSRAGVSRLENIRSQFAGMSQIDNATLSFEVPDGNNSGQVAIYKSGSDSTTAVQTQLLYTDEYYASTYNIPMAVGEFYSQPGAFTDSTKIVINETQAKALGWKDAQEAMGKQVKFQGGGSDFTIAGVIKDFHFGSMKDAIQPLTFFHVGVSATFRFLSFKLKPGNIGNSIAALQKQWSVLMPGTPFEYKFMDETLEKLYQTEIQLKKASYTATLLSIVIVLLGVLGLVSLSIQRRTKEIGIRKVVGASVTNIISLFMKDFLPVIIVAGIIACPVAYYIMQKWLNDYQYKTPITAQPFLFATIVLGVITAALITIQTIKAGLSNPVKSLRTE
jgi:ABC-type antimicrobial peptide transport system permease subunit